MIIEIINYIKHLRENSSIIFEENIEPSKGLHILIKDLNTEHFPGEKGQDWDYYDGKNISLFLKEITSFEQQGKLIRNDTNKCIAPQFKQILSCSPYYIAFKKKNINKIMEENFKAIKTYFENSINICGLDSDKKELVERFKEFLINNFSRLLENDFLCNMKDEEFIIIYLNTGIDNYKNAYENYLKNKLFLKNDFNQNIDNCSFGLSGFYNGFNDKKPFLKHRTAIMYSGIPFRIKDEDSIYLNDFENLLIRKIFPNPLPIFIDKREFNNSDEIIKIFREDSKLSYSQILKRLFENNPNLVLQNYYLFFFFKGEIVDFDFVSKFRYSMKKNDKYPVIKNIFKLKQNNNVLPDKSIDNVFLFEKEIVSVIFNNSLVKIEDDKYSVAYFGEIEPQYVKGGDLIYQLIMKYRKAFYDYIYKSKEESISSYMLDEILWNSVISDLRNDKFEKGFHTKESNIKEKLNIWFSFYNYFDNRRDDMSSKIPKLIERTREVLDNKDKHFETVEEFTFGAGQLIYYLLTLSETAEKTHALLEPFIQKVNLKELQKAIINLINAYKHNVVFGYERFEKLASEVLGFETEENLKDYQKFVLAGYFAPSLLYEKKEK